MRTHSLVIGVTSGLLGFWAAAVFAAPTAAEKCQASKNKAAGKYAACRQNAEAKLATAGDMAKYATAIGKCEGRYQMAWQKAEEKAINAGASCTTVGDETAVQGVTEAHADNIAQHLAGGTLQDCPSDLPSTPLRTGQTECDQGAGTLGACPGSPAGQDGALLKGLARSYTVNANGTISDNKTGLVWEQLDDNNANGIHDGNQGFTWDSAFKKIQVLNGDVAGCIAANNPDTCCSGAGAGSCSPFAGETDWRLPNRFELETLVDLGRVNPAIDPAFHTGCTADCTTASCSCTGSDYYWSSSTYKHLPSFAWIVYSFDGFVNATGKTSSYYVRAVRGGL